MKRNTAIALFCNTAFAMKHFRGAVIRDLVARGYRVVTIASPDGLSEQEIVDWGAEFVPVPLSRSGVNPIADLLLFFCVFRILAQKRPGVLINYTIKPNIYGAMAATMLRIPSVDVVTGLGYAFLSQSVVAKIARFMLRFSLGFTHRIWFLNWEDLELVCGNRRGLVARASILPGESIDTQYYAPKEYPEGPIRFLMISRLLSDKGIFEYFRAAEILARKHPDIIFDFLGPLDPHNPASLSQKDIEAATTISNLNYLGETGDVRSFIENAHCIVLPSYREGLPRVLLEAASMVRPVIATDVPGCREIVADGETGLLCRPHDADDLAAKIENFIAMSREEQILMGQAARKRIVDYFGERVVYAHYHQLLADVEMDTEQKSASSAAEAK